MAYDPIQRGIQRDRVERNAILSQAAAYVRAARECHEILDEHEADHLRDKALRTLQPLEGELISTYDWSNSIPTDVVPVSHEESPDALGHYWLSEL